MNKSANANANTIGKPTKFVYKTYLAIASAVFKLTGVKLSIDRTGIEGICGSAIILAPHISLKDHIILGLTLLPERPTFVLSEHFMCKPVIGTVIRKFVHGVTKKMFCPDTGTIRGILRAKNEGNIIVLFPEGRLNAVAHSQKVTEGTPELVKKLGIPVYTIVGNGSALVFPKWGKRYRRGEINVTTERIFTADEVKAMSTQEISQRIDEFIYHDDEKAMEGKIYRCRKTAKGLEWILYKCPECGKELCIGTKGREIFCRECGFKTELGENYRFTSGRMKSVNEWFYWQKGEIKEDVSLETDVKIAAVGEDGKMHARAGSGHLWIDMENFALKANIFGGDIEIRRRTADIGGAPYTPRLSFNIYWNKRLICLAPSERRLIPKYVGIIDLASEKQCLQETASK